MSNVSTLTHAHYISCAVGMKSVILTYLAHLFTYLLNQCKLIYADFSLSYSNSKNVHLRLNDLRIFTTPCSPSSSISWLKICLLYILLMFLRTPWPIGCSSAVTLGAKNLTVISSLTSKSAAGCHWRLSISRDSFDR